MTLKY